MRPVSTGGRVSHYTPSVCPIRFVTRKCKGYKSLDLINMFSVSIVREV